MTDFVPRIEQDEFETRIDEFRQITIEISNKTRMEECASIADYQWYFYNIFQLIESYKKLQLRLKTK